MKKLLSLIITVSVVMALTAYASVEQKSEGIDMSQLNKTLAKAHPGETIIIKDGQYDDVQLKMKAKGTAEQPITIKAYTNGEVIIGGQSNMKIGGEYLIIEGFYFKDGVLGSDPVITFKEGGNVAKHCRLTNTTIDNYNPKSRFLKSDWVTLYGQHNRIDHCTFTNKYNAGLMIAVKLSGVESQNNHHQLDHNYFSNRPRLGSNGGETVRIGTSTNSLEPAHVKFTDNYFEHCCGEVEILSVKSTDNVISGNVFYECEGVMALRHGNKNVVTNNTFIGNNKPNTGGIRVINAGHIITNNHFQDLTGFRFWSALAVMNGVPNSAINRYHQVKDVTIEDNTFVNCDHMGFGIGSDNERTALPQNVTFKNNSIYSEEVQDILFLDDMSGITFEDNRINDKVLVENIGFATKKLQVIEEAGLKLITGAGVTHSVAKEDCGSDWFMGDDHIVSEHNLVEVGNAQELQRAVKEAKDGDVITLTEATTYYISEALVLSVEASIVSAVDLAKAPIVKYKENTGDPILIIAEGGDVTLSGIDFEGLSAGGIAPCAIKTQTAPFLTQYNLRVDDCQFYNFNAGGRTVFSATPTSYADTVLFQNCKFSNISGIAINLKAEKDDIGRYNAENVIVKNCLFYDVMGSAVDLYRGGNDESTSGPKLAIDHCTFYNVENRELGSVIHLTGVQQMSISNCLFSESGKSGRIINMESPQWADCKIDYCNFHNTGRIETFYDNRLGDNIWKIEPVFTSIENQDFSLVPSSVLLKKSNKRQAIGYQQ